MWSKKDRMLAVLSGELPDRPPVSAWRHFTETEHSGARDFANQMLEFQEKFDFDYVKMQNRAIYCEEVWGFEYDYDSYGPHNGKVIPDCSYNPITCDEDLEKIVEMPASAWPLAEQVEAVKLIQKGLKEDMPIFNSIMCPTSTLQKMLKISPIGRYRPATREDKLVTLMQEKPELVHRALKNITRTMCSYAEELVKAGTFGIFYGATGFTRTGYFTREEWEEFVRPYDMEVIEALKPCKIMLHACGIHVNPEWFADYPIDILHWPESATGNPPLTSAPQWLSKNIVPMGGVDERLFGQNKAAEIAEQTRNTVKKMKEIPFVLGPDCSLALNTRDDELEAFVSAARETI